MHRLRHFVQYLTMVGIPVIGLLGILRLGQGLQAPMAVRGTYRVVRVGGAVTPCLLPLLADSLVVITQSGARLDVRFGDQAPRFAGVLEGNRVDARGIPAPTASCSAPDTLDFTAQATRSEHDVVLEARLGPVSIAGTRPRRPRR